MFKNTNWFPADTSKSFLLSLFTSALSIADGPMLGLRTVLVSKSPFPFPKYSETFIPI